MGEVPARMTVGPSASALPRLSAHPPHPRARTWLLVLLVGGSACGESSPDRSSSSVAERVVALVGGTVYVAADTAPVPDGAVVMAGERVTAAGPRGSISIPAGASVIDVAGGAIVPAFWNSHVHLTDPRWTGVDTMPAARVESLLVEMFTRYGFAHVVDIGSFPEVTLALRRRIRSGEVMGPDILTTLAPFVPPNGTPRYVAPLVLPELHDAAAARDSVRVRIAQGADGIKLFTVPITRARPFPVMAADIVQAATREAHDSARFVVAHPTNLDGMRVAVEHGVDVLAHTTPMAGALPERFLRGMAQRRTALIPTLTLWEEELRGDTTEMRVFVQTAQRQVRDYTAAGGIILFGTDAGYIGVFDPTREYALMAGAGLDYRAILASLTTAPAGLFDRAGRTGRLAPGRDADVVVLDGDPWQDLQALARVRLTILRGRVLHDARARARR